MIRTFFCTTSKVSVMGHRTRRQYLRQLWYNKLALDLLKGVQHLNTGICQAKQSNADMIEVIRFYLYNGAMLGIMIP